MMQAGGTTLKLTPMAKSNGVHSFMLQGDYCTGGINAYYTNRGVTAIESELAVPLSAAENGTAEMGNLFALLGMTACMAEEADISENLVDSMVEELYAMLGELLTVTSYNDARLVSGIENVGTDCGYPAWVRFVVNNDKLIFQLNIYPQGTELALQRSIDHSASSEGFFCARLSAG